MLPETPGHTCFPLVGLALVSFPLDRGGSWSRGSGLNGPPAETPTAGDRELKKGPRATGRARTSQGKRGKARNRNRGLARGPGKERTKDGGGEAGEERLRERGGREPGPLANRNQKEEKQLGKKPPETKAPGRCPSPPFPRGAPQEAGARSSWALLQSHHSPSV